MKKMILLFSMILLISSTLFGGYPEVPVNLGLAESFVILSQTGVSTLGTTAVVGDIAVSSYAATSITGFDLIMDSSGTFSTSALVTGKIYAADYEEPTPTNLTTAVSNMQTAFTDAAGRTDPDHTELYSGDLTGHTLSPGLYKWGTSVNIYGAGVTISGSETDVWIFQIAQDLTVANTAIVTLSGGAKPENIFWQVAGQTTIGTTVQFKGIILCQTLISMNTEATIDGRLLAQTAVTLDANSVVEPSTYTEPAVPGTGSGSSTGGAPAVVVLEPIEIGGSVVSPNVIVDPDGLIDIGVEVEVSGTATNPGAPNTDLSFSVTITGNVAGETIHFILDYTGLAVTPTELFYWNGSAWAESLNLVFTPPTVEFDITFPESRGASLEIVLGADNPLPVTLTNFMAQYLNNQFVRVNWTTESESNMYGYRLYRSQSDLNDVEYTSNLIAANNTPETQVYSIEDYEVRSNETYNYWIEALDMDGTSTMHGPVSVFIDEEIVPELPAQTALKGNYPNPFNPVTYIRFDVKEGEIAELSIYNAKGQLVERESFEAIPGGHVYSWQATGQGSGIYFYQLRSESYSSVKKMIMIK